MTLAAFFKTFLFLIPMVTILYADTWEHHTKNTSQLAEDTIFAMCMDNNANLWVVCPKSIVKISGSGWAAYTGDNGLPSIYAGKENTFLYDFAIDNNNRLHILARVDFMSNKSLGVLSGNGNAWEVSEGFYGGPVSPYLNNKGIAVDRQGNPWVLYTGMRNMSEGAFVEKYENGSWTAKGGMIAPTGFLKDIAIDAEGKVWINGFRYSATENKWNTVETGAMDFFTFDKQSDYIWGVSRDNALIRYDKTEDEAVAVTENLSVEKTYTIFQDSQNKLWIGGENGITVVTENIPAAFEPNGETFDKLVCAIAEDADGGMWFGTVGDGLYYYKEGASIVQGAKIAGKQNTLDFIQNHHSSVTISINGSIEDGTFLLMTPDGRLITTKSLNTSSRQTITLPSLAKGLYVVGVRSNGIKKYKRINVR